MGSVPDKLLMPTLKFLDYRPDVSDANEGYSSRLRGVIPRADGYGPMPTLQALTGVLPAACRGSFVAYAPDGTVAIFAGTSTKLYKVNNTTFVWEDVSLSAGTYSTLSADANWVFCQFNDLVVATQKNAVMQVFDLTGGSAFANLGGSPPQAGWVGVVSEFIVACDLLDTPLRVHWCGLNAVTSWTAGTALSDFQDMPDGGRVRAVAEIANGVGLICQDKSFRRMIFAPGSQEIFQIGKLMGDRGILAPYSLVAGNGFAHLLSTRGFVEINADGALTPIGEERVDRTFLGQHALSVAVDIRNLAFDAGQMQLVQGAQDPQRSLVLWVYKSQAGASGLFDRGLIYHTTLKRWAPVEASGEYILQAARPGITLEGLDAIAPGVQSISNAVSNGGLIRLTVGSTAGWSTGDVKSVSGVGGVTAANGNWTVTVINGTTIDLQGSTFAGSYTSGGIVGGSIDALTISFDEISTSALPGLAAFTATHALALFTGAVAEAEIYTGEQNAEGARMEINGVRPITDASEVYASIVQRETLNGSETEGDESLIDEDGNCPVLESARHARVRLRYPAGAVWTFAKGAEVDVGEGSAV